MFVYRLLVLVCSVVLFCLVWVLIQWARFEVQGTGVAQCMRALFWNPHAALGLSNAPLRTHNLSPFLPFAECIAKFSPRAARHSTPPADWTKTRSTRPRICGSTRPPNLKFRLELALCLFDSPREDFFLDVDLACF